MHNPIALDEAACRSSAGMKCLRYMAGCDANHCSNRPAELSCFSVISMVLVLIECNYARTSSMKVGATIVYLLEKNLFRLRGTPTMHDNPPTIRRLVLPFIVAVAGFFGTSYIGYLAIEDLVSNQRKEAQARSTVVELQNLISLAVGAETGQRGFILTGKDYYLKPYRT